MTETEKECIISITNLKDDLNEKSIDRNEEANTSSECTVEVAQSAEVSYHSPAASVKSTEYSTDERIKEIDQAISQDQEVDPIDLYRKLEIIKEIKNKTLYLQRIKSRISNEVECIESESKSLIDFKSELELLVQEEKAHLEELRQIQNDITMMENTIKQTNEDKIKSIDSARRLHQEYKPLKEHVNHLRDTIGLSKTDDNDDEILIETFIKKLGPISDQKNKNHNRYSSESKSKSNSENSHRHRKSTAKETSNVNQYKEEPKVITNQHQANPQAEIPVQLATAALMAHSLRSLSPNSLSQQQQQFQHFNPFILNQVNLNNERLKNLNNEIYQHQQNPQPAQPQQSKPQLQSLPPPFRQQPPPMKTCLSCNQQIHRNAPICPLCKAKSRSTNPKKPKKKTHDTSPTLIKSSNSKQF